MLKFLLSKLFVTLVQGISFLISWFSPSRKGRDYLPVIRDEILLKPVSELVKSIKSGDVSAERVVQSFIDRINETEPFVHGVVDRRFSEAILEARDIDRQIASGATEELLHKSLLGVPFIGKDHVSVQGLALTCGLVARKGIRATEDAVVIQNLRKEGAICLGLGNVPEYSFSVDCGNMLYGRTKNPYDLSRNPGGSTGGGAAVVAYAGSPFAVGTDIGGSIRIPGFCCGLFGYKPTPGVAPIKGFWPEASEETQSFLVTGPLTRHAADLPLVFKAMAGRDQILSKLPHFEKTVDLSKLKVYYMTDAGDALAVPTKPELCERTLSAVKFLRKEYGCEVKQVTKIRGFDRGLEMFTQIVPDSKVSLLEKVSNGEKDVSILRECLKKLVNLSNHTLAILILSAEQSLRKLFCTKQEDRHQKPRLLLQQMKHDFAQLMDENSIFLMPTLPEVATKHNVTLVKFYNFGWPCLFNLLEVPVVQCPVGLSRKGLPIGIQIAALKNQDHLCLAAAAALEKKFGGWISPSAVNLGWNSQK